MGDAGERGDDDQGQGTGGVGGRIKRLLGGRPLSVYGVLLAGVGVLAILLAIVYVTGRGDGTGQETPSCLDVDRAAAEQAIAEGQVERVSIVTEQDRPERGPLAVELELTDGATCWQLPQGIASQSDLNQVIGIVTVYNEVRAGEQRIRFRWVQAPNIPPQLLATATPTPTVTPLPTPTALPTETPPPPTETPVPPTETPPPPTETPPPPTALPALASPTATPATISAPVVGPGTPGPAGAP